jgi:site-specific recombinase XerD
MLCRTMERKLSAYQVFVKENHAKVSAQLKSEHPEITGKLIAQMTIKEIARLWTADHPKVVKPKKARGRPRKYDIDNA